MTDRRATFLMCDDLSVALNGKFTLFGMYPADIVIPGEQAQLGQLVVFVEAETLIERPFKSLAILVKLPGEAEPKVLDASAALQQMPPLVAGRAVMRVRVPFLIPQPLLKPGAIEVTVVHEEGALPAGKQWVITAAQAQAAQGQAGHAQAAQAQRPKSN
jgi:hypothetical protein